MTTVIEIDPKLLGQIKMYCMVKKINQKEFVATICSRDKDFNNFCKQIKELNF